MKITFKDASELKAHALERLKDLEDAGIEHVKALAQVNAYLTKSEFCSSEGHILKLTLDDGQPEGADPVSFDGKAMGKIIADGVRDGLKGLTEGLKSASIRPNVTVEGDDWERMLVMKREGQKFPNWGFHNVAEFAQSVFMSSKAHMPLDPRIELMRKAHAQIRAGLSSGTISYEKALKFGGVIEKATPTTYASELVGADGGFMVPPEYREQIWIAVRDQESILSMTDLTPTDSNVVNLVADQNVPWDNTAGIITGWRAQGTTMTQSKPVLQNRQVQLNEIFALVPATDELIQDTPQLNNYLSVKAPEKIGWQIDEAIFRGNGNGQPLGFLNSPALISITSASSTLTYTPLDVSNLLARLLQPSMRNPTGVWIMNPSAYAYSINLAQGTSVGFPLFQMGQSLEGKILPTLMGMPIYQSQHAGAWTSANDIILCDLKRGYAAFNKTNGIDFQTSIHLFFDAGATAFRWRFRIGGEPYLKTAVASAQASTATYSHFIGMPSR